MLNINEELEWLNLILKTGYKILRKNMGWRDLAKNLILQFSKLSFLFLIIAGYVFISKNNLLSLEFLIKFDFFVAVYSHLRLMILHKNHMNKVNTKTTYILTVNFFLKKHNSFNKNDKNTFFRYFVIYIFL